MEVVEDPGEDRGRVLVRGGLEEGHARAQLLRVDGAEHDHRVGVGQVGEGSCALDEPGAEHRVGEVGAGLGEPGDGIPAGGLAVAETGDLGQDEPHPVAALAAGAQLGEGGGIRALLGPDEALEVVGIAHGWSLPDGGG